MDEIRAHLPEEPNTFVGRERELVELRQLLHRTRALTLCGPGGIGKTRLALRLLASVGGGVPGRGLVRRAGRPAAARPGGLAHRGGHRDHRGGRAARCSRRWATRCGRGGCCWPWTTASTCSTRAPQVCRRLLASAPGLRLLATSREPLRSRPRRSGGCRRCRWPRRRGPGGSRPEAPSATRRSGCSPTGPRRPGPGSPSARTTPRPSPRSAARWTACRWRSSWPRPGSGRCRWSRSPPGWTTGSGC